MQYLPESVAAVIQALKRFSSSSCPPPMPPRQLPLPPAASAHPDANIDPRLLEASQPSSTTAAPTDDSMIDPRLRDPPQQLSTTSAQPDDSNIDPRFRDREAMPPPPLPAKAAQKERRDSAAAVEGLLPGISNFLGASQRASASTEAQSLTQQHGGSAELSRTAGGKVRKAKTVHVSRPGQNPQRLWEEKMRREAEEEKEGEN